jgi:hypothetical protein
MTPPEYEIRIQEIKTKLKKLTPPLKTGKKETAEERDYKADKAKLEKQLELVKKYATIYTQIHVGDGVATEGKTGVIIEKTINVGGLPQVWVHWGVSAIPYPEYPAISGEWCLQFFPACGLDEAVVTELPALSVPKGRSVEAQREEVA